MMHPQVFTVARRADHHLAWSKERERKALDQYWSKIEAQAPGKVAPEEMHVRGMLLCNSERDHYYSRFSPEALTQVAELLPGRPVMIGHDTTGLPIGRFFAGERTFIEQGRKPRRDSYWVEGLFTIPRDGQGDAIVKRIDQGIYRDVSLGWRCLGAECSICHNHIADRQRCDHVPGEVYDEGLCEFEFSDITAVMEGSLVYAGGQKDTQLFVPDGERQRSLVADSGIAWSRLREFKSENLTSEQRGRQLRGSIHTVVCAQDRFETEQEAKRWVRDHDFRPSRVSLGGGAWRFPQFDSERTTRSVTLDDHVTGEVGPPLRRDLSFDDVVREG